jgi:HlyD family secretion protein
MSHRFLFVLLLGLAWPAPGFVRADDPKPLPVRLLTHKVQRQKIDLTILERGTLESQDNGAVVCRVKALKKDSTNAGVIKVVHVKDGEMVKKGQLLVELDASSLEERHQEQKLARDAAKVGAAQARTDLAVIRSQNESDLAAANTTLKLAKLDLEKYVNGEYESSLTAAKAEAILAEANVELWTDEAALAERKLKDKLISSARARYARLRLESARLALAKCQKELNVLKLSKGRTLTQLEAAVPEAEAVLKRAKLATSAKEEAGMNNLAAKKAILDREQARCDELEAEVGRCKLHAPRDGLLIFVVPEQARFGAGGNLAIVREGETVREGQKLMTIPDLSRMQVAVNIQEKLITEVRVGMPAGIRVDAFPQFGLQGKVKHVAVVASPQSFLERDVKTYRVVIAIDGPVAGLKPGMSATVSLATGKRLGAALTIPSQALLLTGEGGGRRSCLVQAAGGIAEREVVVGFVAEKGAVIESGLKEDDEVIINPHVLLGSMRDRIQLLRRIDRSGRR